MADSKRGTLSRVGQKMKRDSVRVKEREFIASGQREGEVLPLQGKRKKRTCFDVEEIETLPRWPKKEKWLRQSQRERGTISRRVKKQKWQR